MLWTKDHELQYATHKFVRLNLEDRQKIMDEFQITAEDWPLLIRVYYRTQLFLPVEVHAEDLDIVTYLATFIGVPLFRVTACSTHHEPTDSILASFQLQNSVFD